MAKVHIYRRQQPDLVAIRDLLIAAGCSSDNIDAIDIINPPGEGSDEEVVVCLLTPDLLVDPELEQVLLRAIDGGRRVVGIWPQHADNSTVPPAIVKYCYSVVPWNVDRVGSVVHNDDSICFQTPKGEALDMPEDEHYVCPEK